MAQLTSSIPSVSLGGHARTGLEDNLYFAQGDLATNQRLTERLVRIVRDMGYEPARQPKHAKFSGCRAKGFRGLSSQSVEQSRRSTVSTTIVPIPEPIVFEDDKLIRFHHCDPADVFLSQYFVLFNELIEDWFTRGLGISFVDQVTKERVSTPIGRVECDFVSASKIGDVLRFRLAVGRIGTSSIQLKFEVRHGENVRVRAKLTVVRASLGTVQGGPDLAGPSA